MFAIKADLSLILGKFKQLWLPNTDTNLPNTEGNGLGRGQTMYQTTTVAERVVFFFFLKFGWTAEHKIRSCMWSSSYTSIVLPHQMTVSDAQHAPNRVDFFVAGFNHWMAISNGSACSMGSRATSLTPLFTLVLPTTSIALTKATKAFACIAGIAWIILIMTFFLTLNKFWLSNVMLKVYWSTSFGSGHSANGINISPKRLATVWPCAPYLPRE